jgi:hypothetical protein
MTDRWMEPVLESWFAQREIAPLHVRESTAQIMTRIPQTRQRGRWWPMPSPRRTRPASSGQAPARGSLMFSALKFVAAGVIVTLFGGLLMAGVLNAPQDEGVFPAAPTATASSAPRATPEADPSPAVEDELPPTTIPARVSELGLETREFEPGVLVLRPNDGRDAHELVELLPDIVGLDGSWWRFRTPQDWDGEELPTLTREGDGTRLPWKRYWVPIDDDIQGDIEVGPDGVVWARLDKGVISSDGSGWTIQLRTPKEERWASRWSGSGPVFEGSVFADLEIAPDGSVWVARLDADANEVEILRFDGAEWGSVGTFPEVPTIVHPDSHLPAVYLSSRGHDTWLATSNPLTLRRYRNGAWEDVALPARLEPIVDAEGYVVSNILDMRAGPDGTLWMQTIRPPCPYGCTGGFDYYDGSDWDALPEGEPGRVGSSEWAPNFFAGIEALAPDGGLWLRDNEGWGACAGISRVVGTTRTHHFLARRCVSSIAITPGGDVWLTAGKKMNEDSATTKLFLIPAESVAATDALPA